MHADEQAADRLGGFQTDSKPVPSAGSSKFFTAHAPSSGATAPA
eukprot:CAMPEP_0182542516 /NCGR_PEP_ID=MMETSP1323-20130603/30279_1 /TAXON_ID=236787 /ORGANISM="Florenciella parvula, Strain RCC1693" /LENGTH=43 /DNA_ID= /DNA_START= /DNA_END= /DNA_ORIENTATION=